MIGAKVISLDPPKTGHLVRWGKRTAVIQWHSTDYETVFRDRLRVVQGKRIDGSDRYYKLKPMGVA